MTNSFPVLGRTLPTLCGGAFRRRWGDREIACVAHRATPPHRDRLQWPPSKRRARPHPRAADLGMGTPLGIMWLRGAPGCDMCGALYAQEVQPVVHKVRATPDHSFGAGHVTRRRRNARYQLGGPLLRAQANRRVVASDRTGDGGSKTSELA